MIPGRPYRYDRVVKANDYRDTVAGYIHRVFGAHGLTVYTEVSLGKTIIGKSRRIDVFALRKSDQRALAIECKFQNVSGTTDEKIPYALQDLEALWIPGCLAYGGEGWSGGVLQTLRGSRRAAYCLPEQPLLDRTDATQELDHVVAAVFGLWDYVIPDSRVYVPGRVIKGLRKPPANAAESAATPPIEEVG